MAAGLQIAISQMQGRVPVTVFRLKGEIDANTHEQLEHQATEAFETGTRYLLLDLSEATYMSSAGLRTLHTIFSILRSGTPDENNGQAVSTGIRDGTFKSSHLKLLSPSPNVLEVLKTAGFDMYLDIYSDLNQAVASF